MSVQHRIGIDLSMEELIALRSSFAGIKLHHHHDIHAKQSGYRLSKIKGQGIDFDEVREYQFGDDIRSIDWKTSAKLQKTYSKTYKEEKERPVFVLVDFNTNMFFGTNIALKSIIAAKLAVLIGQLAVYHEDKIGGVVYGDNHLEIKPKANKAGIQALIRALVYIHQYSLEQQASKQSLMQGLLRIRRSIKPGSLLFIISDFSYLNAKEEALISQIARHNDVVLVWVYDNLERNIPQAGSYMLNDGKNHKILNTFLRKNKTNYIQMFKQKHQQLLEFCQKQRQSLIEVSSGDDLAGILLDSLVIFKK